MDNLAKKRLTNCCGQLDTRQKIGSFSQKAVLSSAGYETENW
jgi:hypothetical protein